MTLYSCGAFEYDLSVERKIAWISVAVIFDSSNRLLFDSSDDKLWKINNIRKHTNYRAKIKFWNIFWK